MDATSSGTNTERELIREFTYDEGRVDGLVVAISEAVADVTETPMEELPPLQATLDCDAMETLFASLDPGHDVAHVQFPYHGCTVRVDTTGTIQVYYTDDRLTPENSRC